ncbi:hypothetical protein SteCoe_14299 [Stentor coeruleus]|uniref:Uncharacterized protein n=1 Tax=Stentor coeruleus TaxID=5963 RepID=A0A1R2C6F1_9CILI|nr:hypothetical protein SteCoe_14299 [Stentor coeruleus]
MKNSNEKSKLSKDSLLESSELNLEIADGLFLSDLLRIEFDIELRLELVLKYLKAVLPSEYSIIFILKTPIQDNTIVILPDWSVLLATPNIRVALNTSSDGFFSFYHDSQGPKSYIVLSFLTKLISVNDMNLLPPALKQVSDSLSIARIKSDIAGYLYSVSKFTAKNLLMKYSEAKDLLCPEIISPESSISSTENLPPMAKRIIGVKLFEGENLEKKPNNEDIDEFTSFEYSLSEETSQKFTITITNTEKIINKETKELELTGQKSLRQSCLSFGSGIESPRFTSLESSQSFITPLASPRLFDYPSNEMSLIVKFHEMQEYALNSCESEKLSYKTSCSETPVKKDESLNCYKCEICTAF